MKHLKLFYLIVIPILLLSIGSYSIAYEPMEDETITKISKLSDTFLYGSIKGIAYLNEGRPITINKVEIKDIFFDRTGRVSIGDDIDVITRGGFFTDDSGKRVKIKELNAPELVKGTAYIIYLRWDSSRDAFTPTSGESSVFEVDMEGKVLNIHGYYILDVKAGKLVVGPSKILDTQRKETSPPAVVEDIYGNTTTIQPQMPSVKTQEIDPGKLLNLQKLLEKVQGVAK